MFCVVGIENRMRHIGRGSSQGLRNPLRCLRLDLIERLWDSLSVTQDDIPLTDAQRAELDRRLDELEEKGPIGVPWEQVVDSIKSKGA